MSKRIIEIHYHPAIKTIIFKDENGNKLTCDELNCWQKSTFVLQEHGEDLFKSIVSAKDGVQEIHIRFFGTQVDYEDFEGMVNFYNNTNGDASFTCEQCGVLISMEDMYDKVKEFGDEVIQQIDLKAKSITSEYDERSNDSYEINQKFKNALIEYKEKIKEKLAKLQSININICFVGTYSSGKSSLINAIIGEKILPEADESKTAKFFIITSPITNEKEGITFVLDGTNTSVEWNGTALELDNNTGTHELRKKIQTCIDNNVSEFKHKQFYQLIDLINGKSDIGIEINIRYHIPMDTSTMSFTIYDTPGSGSNTSMHEQVLSDALSEQSNSIVVFVGGVTKLEGEGNSKLLKMLNGENKNSIDIDRSLFVINRADTTSKSKLGNYKTETIKIKDSADIDISSDNQNITTKLEIPLMEKKLFFTSAAQASAAKAKKNGYATDDDEEYWQSIKPYAFYEFNQCGKSQLATERMLKRADKAYNTAEDEYEKAYINVGLYSLIEAIKEYGEKYAMATKVNSLVLYVSDIICKLQDQAKRNKNICFYSIEELDKDLVTIKNRIEGALNAEYESRCPQKENELYHLGDDEQKELLIDSKTTTKIINDIDASVAKELTHNNRLKNEINIKYVDEQNICAAANKIINNHLQKFNKAQNEILQKKQDDFKDAITNIINNNDGLTNEAKKALQNGLPKIKVTDSVNYYESIEKLFDSNVQTKRWLFFFKKKVINTKNLRENIKSTIIKYYTNKTVEMNKFFCENLIEVLKIVNKQIIINIDEYSTKIQTIKQNKQELLNLADNMINTANELRNSKNKLEKIIWRNEV